MLPGRQYTGVIISSYERKSRGRKLADEMRQDNSHGTLQSDALEESDL